MYNMIKIFHILNNSYLTANLRNKFTVRQAYYYEIINISTSAGKSAVSMQLMQSSIETYYVLYFHS